MIRFENFSFSYGDLINPQIRNFNFTIKPSQCVLLCGASACGKTTAAKCINGLIPHFTEGNMEGAVLLNGEKISDIPSWELSSHIGSVFQNPKTQFFNLDSSSELVFGMENLGIPTEEMHSRVKKVAEELEIQALLNRDVFSLSGGEKQLLALASVYAMNPDVYVLDEPTANMDQQSIAHLMRILRKLKRDGKTIVISEHRLYFLMDLIDQAVWIEHGAIRNIFTGDQFRAISDEERIRMGLRCFKAPEKLPGTLKETQAGLLQVRDLSVRIGKKQVLQDISFSADPGDIIAVTGGNGSGKTTFLRTLCGLLREHSGTVTYDGRPYSFKKRRALCAMTMQDVAHQLFGDSVEAEFSLLNRDIPKEQIDSILQTLDLQEYRDHHPMTLSGGQKQRLAIGAASLSGKQILTFDEPTSGLDYGNMCQVSRLIQDLAKDRIIFIATHDRELVNMLCTKELSLHSHTAQLVSYGVSHRF